MKMKSLSILFVVIIVNAIPAPVAAQEFRGSILGRITDSSGAVVPGATVSATNEESRVKTEAVSNHAGNYVIPFLLPGRYAMSAHLTGFKTVLRRGIVVQVQDKITLDFTLEPGGAEESVTVTAEAPLLQRANADLGQVVDRHFLERLPITGSSVMNLTDMAPGVIAGSGGYTSNAQSEVSINGGNGKDKGNDIAIDGVPNVVPRQRGLAVTIPMADAIEEFKVHTTMFDASLGRSNGGAISMSTRSGTNTLHGTAYYFHRDKSLNANTWTNNRLGQPRPTATQYLGGATVGGPVRLPRYDGHDRTFFFAGYERVSNPRPITAQARVPTELERRGDFSQTLARTGVPLMIYNPFETVVDGSSRFVSRPAFEGARIPASLINPVGQAVINLLPLPNLPGPAQIGRVNWAKSASFTTDTNNWQVRLDHQLSSRQRLYARFSQLTHFAKPTPIYFPGAFSVPPDLKDNIGYDRRRFKTFSLDDTVTFSPSFVGSFRVGFTRSQGGGYRDGDERDPALLNLPQSFINHQRTMGWPIFNLDDETMPFIGSSGRGGTVNNVYSGLANLNKLQGRHSFRFGLDYRLLRWNDNRLGDGANGVFKFTNAFTRSDPTVTRSGDTSGTIIASLLLGLPTSSGSSIGSTSDMALQNHSLALFFQDDLKLSRRLTLNLGLRYELETPFTERYDRLPYDFDPNADVGLANVAGLGEVRGGLRFVNTNGLPRRQGNIDWNNVGPRVGFAFSLNDKTVLRGGYGIFYSSLAVNCCISSSNPQTITTFGSTTPYVSSANSDATPLPGVTLSNPFPNGYRTPTGAALDARTELGNRVNYVNPDRVLPYVQQWQLSAQRELPWRTLLEVAYVGTHSVKLFEDFQLNETPDAFNVPEQVNVSVPNPFFGLIPNTSTIGRSTTIRANKLHVRYPQFDRVQILTVNSGRALYHGLQTRLQKHLSNGLAFTAHYTFSKILVHETNGRVNPRGTRSIAETDHPHIFRTFITYDLPFGHDRGLGKQWPGWLDGALGGWSLTWVTKYTSGNALPIVDSGHERPIVLRDPNLDGPVDQRLGDHVDPATGRPMNPYFDTTAFQRVPDFTVSPAPKRYGWLRGPSDLRNSMALFKTVSLARRTKLELRAEVSNVFNSPVFDDPGVDLNDPTSFGVITSAGGNRTIQVGAKLKF